MKESVKDFKWLDVRFTPRVEKVLTDYLASKSNPEAETDFDNWIISDNERENYIRYTLFALQQFWIKPPGKKFKPKSKTPEEIEEMQINRINDFPDDEIIQLEDMGL